MSGQRVVVAGLLGFLCTLGGGCSPSEPCCSPAGNPARSSPNAATVPANQQVTQATDCCSLSSTNLTALPGTSDAADPARQVIFKVEGLTCPAVKGLGCGHRIAPVLAQLNKIEGVEKSFANRTGTLLRICVAASADRDKVATTVREDLTKDNRKPVPLAGEEFKEALVKEKWGSPSELSAIEFRTLALRRVKTFVESEKLDTEAASKLVKIAEQQWERMAKGIDCCKKEQQPADWLVVCHRSNLG